MVQGGASRGIDQWRSPRRPTTTIGVNLTAMIDVVFLLLIYFVVATDFRRGEDVFRLDLPDRGGAALQDVYDEAEEPLVIRLNGTPATPPGYRIVIEGPWPPVEDAGGLRVFMEAHRVGSSSGGQEFFASDHPIVIVATPRTAWSHVVDVFNAVVGAGYDVVSLESP